MASWRFDAIGADWTVDTPEPLPDALQGEVRDLVDVFDTTWSRFRHDSLIGAISTAAEGGCFAFPDQDEALFDLYEILGERTQGAVELLVGHDLDHLGYDANYRLEPRSAGAAQDRPRWAEHVRRDGAVLHTRRPLMIDVGAAGKGFLVDRVAGLLAERGTDTFVVDGSGDMTHRGTEPLRIGLEHPVDPQQVIGVATLANAALCASAVNRRCWGDGLHHIVDGRTGLPTDNVIATWVLCGDAMTADGLATALFFASAERLAAAFQFEFVRMFADGRAEWSLGFPGEIFIKEHVPCRTIT